MFDADDIVFAVKALRPFIRQILAEKQALSLEKEIDILLERSDRGEKVDNLLLELLSGDERLREWLKSALLEDSTRGQIEDPSFGNLPGDVGGIAAKRFRCPRESCGFNWFLRRVGQPIPFCPVHQTILVLSS